MRSPFKPLIVGVVAVTTFSLCAAPAFAATGSENATEFSPIATSQVATAAPAAQTFETKKFDFEADQPSILELTSIAGSAGHNFDVDKAIAAAESEVGTSRATGWSAPGECIQSARRWLLAGNAYWDGGSDPVSAYRDAVRLGISDAQPGDVIQYESIDSPTSWVSGVHTLLITGVNGDGTYTIIQSNVPGGSGLVTKVENWTPEPPAGFQAVVWRF